MKRTRLEMVGQPEKSRPAETHTNLEEEAGFSSIVQVPLNAWQDYRWASPSPTGPTAPC